MTPAQLPLDLGHRPAHDRDDFLVTASNHEAVAWIDRWPDWPVKVAGLNVYGPTGCGKTHLSEVWRTRCTAASINAEELAPANVADLLGGNASAVIDDFSEQINFQAAFHLHNLVVERGGSLLILSEVSVSRLEITLADLRSRLNAIPTVGIGPPDDDLLMGIFEKLFADRQLAVGTDVLAFLLPRVERSFAAAQSLVDAVDAASLAQKRPVTLPLVRDVLNKLIQSGERE